MSTKTSTGNKKTHELFLKFKVYSHEVSNIRRHKAKENIISPRVNKIDIQRKYMQYLIYHLFLTKKVTVLSRSSSNNFTKFTGKHLCLSLFLFWMTQPAILFKKRLWRWCFPVNFVKFSRTPFLTEHLWTTASVYQIFILS